MECASELQERGFIVIPGVVQAERVQQVADAYDAALSSASRDDTKIGSTSTMVNDYVNGGAEFDTLYGAAGVADCLQRIHVAWPHRDHVTDTAPLAPRWGRSSRRMCRD